MIKIERSLDPLLLQAATPDKSLAAVVRVDAEATEARIVLKPTAAASGRLTDQNGKAIAGRNLSYGIRVHTGPAGNSPFSWQFGGTTTTDGAGRFHVGGLVVGESYEIYVTDEEGYRLFTAETKIMPANAGRLALGDVPINLSPPPQYVPPTAAQSASRSFADRAEKNAQQKLDDTLIEARREYTRPLLLFGKASDPACVELFRWFSERSRAADTTKGGSPANLPGDLRWEFELCSLDAARADVKALSSALGVPSGGGESPLLAVLSNDGKLIATYPLRSGGDKALSARPLGAFLLEHKLPTRDAQTMLADALAKANAEHKRVFLIMSASWCGPCRVLARFLAANKAELERHFVFVKLDISRDTRALELKERYEGKDASNGVPWYVILDAAGKPLVTSNSKELQEWGSTNIGFPSTKTGIAHFLKMLRETAPALSDAALVTLRQRLDSKN
jgi:thiol-disulfide isomerase/thioredoxin